VIDKTGLDGGWDFDFKFTFRARPGAGAPISVSDALSKIGLKLEAATVPLPVIAVDLASLTTFSALIPNSSWVPAWSLPLRRLKWT
jgi:uncharacterized protein (TIGR03435 family)